MRGFRLVGAIALTVSVCCGVSDRALALPKGRVYEMVSEPYKGGYGVDAIAGVLPGGEGVVFRSRGAFAETPRDELIAFYLARRGESSWSSTPLEPPATVAISGNQVALSGDHADLSPTGAVLWKGCPAPNDGSATSECTEKMFVEYSAEAATWTMIGEPVKLLEGQPLGTSFAPSYQGASPDFCHIVFTPGGEGPLVAEARGTQAELYDMASGCGGPPMLRLVGLNNKGKVIDPYCVERLGGWGNASSGKQFNAIADGGQEVFFTAFVEPGDRSEHCGGAVAPSPVNPSQLFVRLDGSRTVEVSRPLGRCEKSGVAGEVPCDGASKRAPALFWGATEDGSKVFFTTPAPLTGENDETNNLYMANIGCPSSEEKCEISQMQVTSLLRVSRAPQSGEAAGVQGVVQLAPDGSHLYFVASGVLSEEAGPEGRLPAKGADNLYVYNSLTGRSAFVAELCSGADVSGLVADARCPGGSDSYLWDQLLNEATEAQMNVCDRPSVSECEGERETGRFFVFTSFGQLLKGDTDNARDVYRYDAQTDALDRVSSGEGGYDANGNCEDGVGETVCDALIVPKEFEQPTAVYAQQEMVDRAISEDGSRIVFRTAGPLSPDAISHAVDVYEWHKEAAWSEGKVSIISTGSSLTSDSTPVITSSGKDIFFLTSQKLVPPDTDGQRDVYDARLGGGFPPAPTELQQCSGDGCQGPLTNPVPLLVPGSVSQTSDGNFAAPPKRTVKVRTQAKRRIRTKKKHRKKGKKASRGYGSAGRSAGRGVR